MVFSVGAWSNCIVVNGFIPNGYEPRKKVVRLGHSTRTKLSDYFGFAVAFSFGLWWLAFPGSVISFYSWFHRGSVAMPKAGGVRMAGALWVVLVAVVMAGFWSRI